MILPCPEVPQGDFCINQKEGDEKVPQLAESDASDDESDEEEDSESDNECRPSGPVDKECHSASEIKAGKVSTNKGTFASYDKSLLKKKLFFKNFKFRPISWKKIIRHLVKTASQKKHWFKSYGQKTVLFMHLSGFWRFWGF